jgi:RNA polymerase sigma factor (sigma-70 family)
MLSPDFAQTLAAARKGDRAALDRLLAEVYPQVRELVHAALATDLRRRRPWLTAMFSTGDVVQEVFCGVIRDLDGFEGVHAGAFVRYLATMVKNRLVDAVRFHEARRRDVRRARDHVDPDSVGKPVDPSSLAEYQDELIAYTRALATFPQREQVLLRERLHGGQTFKDLASLLGYGSEDAARRAFHAAQARLLLRLGNLADGGRSDPS